MNTAKLITKITSQRTGEMALYDGAKGIYELSEPYKGFSLLYISTFYGSRIREVALAFAPTAKKLVEEHEAKGFQTWFGSDETMAFGVDGINISNPTDFYLTEHSLAVINFDSHSVLLTSIGYTLSP